MYIRWLGAFRCSGTLEESLKFEFARISEVACEQLQNGASYMRRSLRLGLLVDPTAVTKRFKKDVWSEYNANGRLRYTHKEWAATSAHKESWAMPVYTGIVIRGGSLATLSYEARNVVLSFAKDHNIPVYRLSKGRLIPEEI